MWTERSEIVVKSLSKIISQLFFDVGQFLSFFLVTHIIDENYKIIISCANMRICECVRVGGVTYLFCE